MIFLPWLVAIGLVSWQDLTGTAAHKAAHTIKGLPLPADYGATFLLFGLLGLASNTGFEKPAAAAAWGIDIALLLQLFGGSNPVGNKLLSSPTLKTAETLGSAAAA